MKRRPRKKGQLGSSAFRVHSSFFILIAMDRIRILIVDDSPDFLDVASGFLSADPRIEVAGRAVSGEEGIEAVGKIAPDLVLMDIAMPGINGLEAARRIQGLPKPPRIVVLTLYDNPEYRAAAAAIPVAGFVPKSELASALLPLIHGLFPGRETAMPPKEPTMKQILIVDDSRTMRKMVRASLEKLAPVQFHEAENGLDAIEKLALQPVDLMVLDLNMPDMHGMEVIRFVRSNEAYRGIPILVLTTKGDQTSRGAALAAGADRYMTKPFDPRQLAGEAGQLLGGERGTS